VSGPHEWARQANPGDDEGGQGRPQAAPKGGAERQRSPRREAPVGHLVGRTLRPVEAIRAEVAAMGGSALDRRVPEPGGDDEIARLAQTMNAMLDRVETAARRQQQFVADASHELRTLRRLGVSAAQGYFLGRPGPMVAVRRADALTPI